jgi:hypothetical protein
VHGTIDIALATFAILARRVAMTRLIGLRGSLGSLDWAARLPTGDESPPSLSMVDFEKPMIVATTRLDDSCLE